jgi:hypothetical protein
VPNSCPQDTGRTGPERLCAGRGGHSRPPALPDFCPRSDDLVSAAHSAMIDCPRCLTYRCAGPTLHGTASTARRRSRDGTTPTTTASASLRATGRSLCTRLCWPQSLPCHR